MLFEIGTTDKGRETYLSFMRLNAEPG